MSRDFITDGYTNARVRTRQSSVEESLYEVAANEKSCGVYRAFKRPGRPV